MQSDKMQESDLQMRSILQEAEQEVPAGVWEGIEARLAFAAPAAVPHKFKWGWAAAGLAMAAAIAAALFIPANNSNLVDISGSGHSALTSASVIETPAIPAAKPLKSLQRPARYAQAVESESVAEPAAIQGDASGAANTQAPRASQGEVSGSAPEAGAPKKTQEFAAADPFAAMQAQDALRASKSRKGGLSLSLSGSVAGNQAAAGGRALAASGSGYSQSGITENSISTFSVPLTFGVGVRFGITPVVGIGSGVDYTLLTRTFTGTYAGTPDSGIRHTVQYIGIPLNVYANLFRFDRVGLYVFAGGEAEKCISNRYSVISSGDSMGSAPAELQFSAGLGFGVEFRFSRLFSVYIDPSARYFFDCGQPKSIRTEKPFQMTFNAGIRFNL